MSAGKYKLVYVAPERLRSQRFFEAIRATPIQLLAIDESPLHQSMGDTTFALTMPAWDAFVNG